MEPIQKLLGRIRWDEAFGRGRFEIGYYDRVEGRIIRVPFQEIEFPEGEKFAFRIYDMNDELVTIPFHRVRQVYKDEELIWERP